MLQFQNINKIYPNGTRALSNINLTVETGKIFGVIGPSGAGKSTLIRCANLLERPSSGAILFNGEDITQQTAKQLRITRQQIGMIFQHFNLLHSRTVYENIALPLQLKGASKKTIANKIIPLLELTGLITKKDEYPNQLSGGQKQRVAIARALVNQPKLLLCDEATSALDPETTQSILHLLKNINDQFGLTIMLITHEMNVVKAICDQIGLIEHSQIVEQANIIDFIMQPKSSSAQRIVKSFLNHDVPETLKAKLHTYPKANSYPVVRLLFSGKVASEPLVAHMIQNLHLELNILHAHLEYIKNEPLGIMIATLMAEKEQAQTGIDFLKNKGLDVEIIGYVN